MNLSVDLSTMIGVFAGTLVYDVAKRALPDSWKAAIIAAVSKASKKP